MPIHSRLLEIRPVWCKNPSMKDKPKHHTDKRAKALRENLAKRKEQAKTRENLEPEAPGKA